MFKLKPTKATAAAITMLILTQSISYAAGGNGLLKARVIDILSTNPFSAYYEEKAPEMPAGEAEEAKIIEEEEPEEDVDALIADHKKYYKMLKKAGKQKKQAAPVKKAVKVEAPAAEKLKVMQQPAPETPVIQTQHQEIYPAGADVFTDEYTPQPEIKIMEDPSLDIYESNEDNTDTLLFEYKRGKSYEVYAAPGYLTDIQLQAGEYIENINIGDRTSWTVEMKQAAGIWHIFIKPLQQGIATNMIINTDRHNYSLRLVAENDYTPVVSWIYPDEAPVERQPEGVTMEVESVDKLNFDYRVSRANRYPWSPTSVFDDGFKTYLVMKQSAAYKYTPAVFQKRSNGQLVHLDYKIVNNSIVIDKVCDELYVCTSNDEYISIKNFRSQSPWN